MVRGRELSARCLKLVTIAFALHVLPLLVGSAWTQGLPRSPYSAASMVWRSTLDLGPSNPLGRPTGVGPEGSDSVYLNSEMFRDLLPVIPNLQGGFVFNFGRNVGQGRGIIDYVLPVGIGDSVFFGEVHSEFQNFWKWSKSEVIARPWPAEKGLEHVALKPNRRTDLAFGGGYRTILGGATLLGANAFFDTTKLADTQWYSAGGIGLETVSLLPGGGFVDLQFNYYGNLFSRSALINAFRNGAGSFDFEVGYSQPLFDDALDLRVKAAGYRFDVYTRHAYGFRLGGELSTRDGRFTARYQYTDDQLNQPYHTVGLNANVGFRLESLLAGENPLTAPEPIFARPPNLRRLLGKPVRRNWHQPTQVVVARSLPALPACLPVTGNSSDTPKWIPDGGSTTSPMSVACTQKISKVIVILTIGHSWDEDLDVYLTSPGGTTVELFTDVGGSGDHFIDTVLDQDAALPITAGSAPFTGTFRPEGDLNSFNGQRANGTWTLTVFDDAAGDQGFLASWTLIIQ